MTYDGHTLLGYDWIAGVLENADIGDQPETLLTELREFRRDHQQDCVGPEEIVRWVGRSGGCSHLVDIVRFVFSPVGYSQVGVLTWEPLSF